MADSRYPLMGENPPFFCLLPALDPSSQFLPQNPNSGLHFTTDSYFMERGPSYDAYARRRELKLRTKFTIPELETVEIDMPKSDFSPSPAKKSVRFEAHDGRKRSVLKVPSSPSIVAQSVPDFSSAIRKENRRPPPGNRMDKSATPPPPMSKSSKLYGSGSKLGSKSANSGEKKGVSMAARKSYASIEELKRFSGAAATAIAGENRGGVGGRRADGKASVLGVRQSVQFY